MHADSVQKKIQTNTDLYSRSTPPHQCVFWGAGITHEITTLGRSPSSRTAAAATITITSRRENNQGPNNNNTCRSVIMITRVITPLLTVTITRTDHHRRRLGLHPRSDKENINTSSYRFERKPRQQFERKYTIYNQMWVKSINSTSKQNDFIRKLQIQKETLNRKKKIKTRWVKHK